MNLNPDDDRDSRARAAAELIEEGYIWRKKGWRKNGWMLGMKDGRGELVYRSGGRNERVRVKPVAYPMGSKPQGHDCSQFRQGQHSEGQVKPQGVHGTGQLVGWCSEDNSVSGSA